MAHHESLSQWKRTVSTHLGVVGSSYTTALAEWSFGMVIAQSCGITSIVVVLSMLLRQSENTLRQRFRELWYAAMGGLSGDGEQSGNGPKCVPICAL